MRISDWSSDVCPSDLCGRPKCPKPRKTLPVRHARERCPQGEWGSGHRSFNHPHFYIGSVRDQAKFSISSCCAGRRTARFPTSGRTLRSEEHTSELQSLMRSSYAVFCLTKQQIHTSIIATNSPYP